MPTIDIFSKRQQRRRGETPDVYVYDEISDKVRIQLCQIVVQAFGGWYTQFGDDNIDGRNAYSSVVIALRKEYGVFTLTEKTHRDTLEELQHHILTAGPEEVLDAVELLCRIMDGRRSGDHPNGQVYAEAVEEINQRFKEDGVGYEFTAGEVIRIDSELIHAVAVKPALALLHDPLYRGAEDEFLSAFEHYRHGKTKESLTDALKAIESTIKVICTKRGWAFQSTDTSKALIEVCLKNDLIPAYWQSHFSSLRSMLEGSVPTARNKAGGHGQGVSIQAVPDYLASYVLHMTASTIVFLVRAEKALP